MRGYDCKHIVIQRKEYVAMTGSSKHLAIAGLASATGGKPLSNAKCGSNISGINTMVFDGLARDGGIAEIAAT